MRKKGVICLLLGVLLFTSCSTLSPFMRAKSYSLLPTVFGKEGETVLLFSLKNEKLKESLIEKYSDAKDIIERTAFLTVAFLKDGTVMGAFEGYYPIDSIRLLTGKNTATYGEWTLFSPDGGIIAFTNGDVREAKDRMFENRENITDENKVRLYFSHDMSVFGSAPSEAFYTFLQNMLGSNTYMDFNKIDISFDVSETEYILKDKLTFLLSGSLDFQTEDEKSKIKTALKAYLVSALRESGVKIDIKDLENRLSESGTTLTLHQFPFPLSYSL